MTDQEMMAGDGSLRRSRDGGFTLVEMLVVIVLLGILAAIVVFAVTGLTDHGQQSACRADYTTVAHAEEAYYAHQTANPQYAQLTDGTSPLIQQGYLHETSKWYDVPTAGATGYTMALTSGSPCALPPA